MHHRLLVGSLVAGPLVVAALALGPSPVLARTQPGSTLPDLVPVPPNVLVIAPADGPNVLTDPVGWATGLIDRPPASTALRFHSRFTNAGAYAFEITGAPSGASVAGPGIATMDALQCEEWTGPPVNGAARLCVGYRNVGTMSWDPHHFHAHLADFARYSLNQIGGDGTPGAVVATSDKVGFCMQDDTPGSEIAADRSPVPGTDDLWWFARHGWYKGCNAPPMPGATYRQGLSPGWNDTYYWPYPGQQVVIDDVPDGEYLLVHTVNPDGRYLEADRSNNRAWVRLRLGTDEAGGRTVTAL